MNIMDVKKTNNNKKLTLFNQIAGILFFILGAQFIVVLMICASILTSYDFKTSAISDFGVYPSTKWIFNISLILVGVLNIIGGYFYFRSNRKIWTLILFSIAGLGAIFAGIFPLNTGDIHSLAALIAFIFFNVEVFVCGLKNKSFTKILGLALGIIGIIFVVIMIIGDSGNPQVFSIIGHGGAERMIVYPILLFLMYFGGYLLGKSNKI
jgi:hypothetical membrane protein